jgi:hypothetical protein
MTPSMAWRFDGRLMVIVHTTNNPSNLEWQRMLHAEQERGRSELNRTLVVSYGGGPDSEQRKLLSQQMAKKPVPICVMTANGIVKAIASALLFFNRQMKVVGMDERSAAFDFLALSASERDAADRLRIELERELGIDRSARIHPSR